MFERIGSYRPLSILAEGGMGVIYRAAHETSGQIVAIKTVKVLRRAMSAGIRKEIAALARIRHPDIIHIIDYGVSEGTPWYAMPLIDGQPLGSVPGSIAATATAAYGQEPPPAPSSPLGATVELSGEEAAKYDTVRRTGMRPAATEEELSGILNMMRDLCDPLAYLHGEGIVHQDLKPANIIVRPSGRPLIVDFGIASHLGRSGRETLEVSAGTAGTAPYMAPEQIIGHTIDARADLYALGCILYELLTGRPPFLATNLHSLFQKHLSEVPEAPSRLLDFETPPELDRLVLQLLSKPPQDRVGYAADLSSRLVAVGAQRPAEIPPAKFYLYRPHFVGRTVQLRLLSNAVAAARLGAGATVFLAGESGAGKTRFLGELARQAIEGGALVLAGETPPVADSPLVTLERPLEIIGDHCRERGPQEARRVIGPRVRILEDYFPALSTIAGPQDYAAPAPLSGQAARSRLYEALAQTLTVLSEADPVVLILDDLQWSDALTLGFVEFMVDHNVPQQCKLVLVASYRIEEAPALFGEVGSGGLLRISLDRLTDAEVGELAQEMLALEQVPPELVRLLASTTSGNPFFVAEYLHSAVESGLVVRNDLGRWQVAEQQISAENISFAQWSEKLQIPNSLHALISQRLEKLSPDARRVAQLAAVFAWPVPSELLGTLEEVGEEELDQALHQLVNKQILALDAQGRYGFCQDKLREISYAAIPLPLRRATHAQIVTWLESQNIETQPELLAQLAHHATRARAWAQAIGYHDLRGHRSLSLAADEEALASFGQAMRLSAVAPTADITALARREAGLAEASFRSGKPIASGRYGRRALARLGYPMPDSGVGLALSLCREIYGFWRVWRDEESAAGKAASEGLDPERWRLRQAVQIHSRLTESLIYGNEAVGALLSALRELNMASRLGPSAELSRAYAAGAVMIGAIPLRRKAKRWIQRALTLAEEACGASDLAHVLVRSAVCSIYDNDFVAARADADRAVEIAEDVGDRRGGLEARTVAWLIQLLRGNFSEVRSQAQETARAARAVGDPQVRFWGFVGEFQCLLRLGRQEDALNILEDAVPMIESATSVDRIYALGLVALLHSRNGDFALTENLGRELMPLIAPRPVAYWTYGGLVALAEATLLYWQAVTDDGARVESARALAKASCRALGAYSRVFPLGRAGYLLWSGLYLWLCGKKGPALRRWKKAMVRARAEAKPYEAALAELELGRHLEVGLPARRDYLLRALSYFEAGGLRYDAERARHALNA